jgi:hypothetical protein
MKSLTMVALAGAVVALALGACAATPSVAPGLEGKPQQRCSERSGVRGGAPGAVTASGSPALCQ